MRLIVSQQNNFYTTQELIDFTNNLTGITSNVYSKCEKKLKPKNDIISNLSNVLDGQLSLLEIVK